uniref:Reverse transcriptase domain-containing protein n=1 Tax=Panagrellus redivivus TaxID=6233 RepID=A0A7E4W619_PANRE
SVIHDARQRGQTAVVAWLDFRNAFPSVPHTTITDALTWTGLDEEAIDLNNNLYDGCTTKIRTQDGTTSAIPINSGVRQGCPLSPII